MKMTESEKKDDIMKHGFEEPKISNINETKESGNIINGEKQFYNLDKQKTDIKWM